MRRTVGIIGIEFTDQTFDEAVGELHRSLDGDARRSVFFANAATLNLAADDPGYARTLRSGDIVYGDGTGIRWAAKIRGVRLQSNLNGTDMIPELLRRRPGTRVFLLGGTQEMIAEAAAGFSASFPEAVLADAHHGYFDHDRSDAVIERINQSNAELLLVGFGNPLQERWIAQHRDRLDVKLAAGVGGLFAYWSGTLTRAPLWYRNLGIEWVHILKKQPHKARRYLLGNPLFVYRMMSWLLSDSAGKTA